MLAPAIQALCHRELGSATGTDRTRLKSVEGLSAIPAFPVSARRRRSLATGTGESLATRQFGEFQNRLSVPQSAPAVQQHEDGNCGPPQARASAPMVQLEQR